MITKKTRQAVRLAGKAKAIRALMDQIRSEAMTSEDSEIRSAYRGSLLGVDHDYEKSYKEFEDFLMEVAYFSTQPHGL